MKHVIICALEHDVVIHALKNRHFIIETPYHYNNNGPRIHVGDVVQSHFLMDGQPGTEPAIVDFKRGAFCLQVLGSDNAEALSLCEEVDQIERVDEPEDLLKMMVEKYIVFREENPQP